MTQQLLPHAGPPFNISLGDTHLVEVKKGGLYIGIYVITPSLRKRGAILPHSAWKALVESADIINSAIDFSRRIALGESDQNGRQYFNTGGDIFGAGTRFYTYVGDIPSTTTPLQYTESSFTSEQGADWGDNIAQDQGGGGGGENRSSTPTAEETISFDSWFTSPSG
jgi:hypothetical protein